MKYKVYGIRVDHVGRETRHYVATFNEYDTAEDYANNYNFGYDKNVVEVENEGIHNINLCQQPGICVVESPRVWWLVKVRNTASGITKIHKFRGRFEALKYAFKMSNYRTHKVYCGRWDMWR